VYVADVPGDVASHLTMNEAILTMSRRRKTYGDATSCAELLRLEDDAVRRGGGLCMRSSQEERAAWHSASFALIREAGDGCARGASLDLAR